jgi:hypothetical protein
MAKRPRHNRAGTTDMTPRSRSIWEAGEKKESHANGVGFTH